MAGFPTLKGSWPWPWPWIGSYRIPSCITHRPIPTRQISLKSKKRFVDVRTGGRTFETGFIESTLSESRPKKMGQTLSDRRTDRRRGQRNNCRWYHAKYKLWYACMKMSTIQYVVPILANSQWSNYTGAWTWALSCSAGNVAGHTTRSELVILNSHATRAQMASARLVFFAGRFESVVHDAGVGVLEFSVSTRRSRRFPWKGSLLVDRRQRQTWRRAAAL